MRFEGKLTVAEWEQLKPEDLDQAIAATGTDIAGWWLVPGSDVPYRDDEVCELIGDRLDPPATPEAAASMAHDTKLYFEGQEVKSRLQLDEIRAALAEEDIL